MVWLIWKPIILLSGTCVYPNPVEGVRQESAGSYLINQTLLDCPVIGMPVGLNAEGLPMGMQIIGKIALILPCGRLPMPTSRRCIG